MARKNLLKGFKKPKGITFEHSLVEPDSGRFIAYPFERGSAIRCEGSFFLQSKGMPSLLSNLPASMRMVSPISSQVSMNSFPVCVRISVISSPH